MSHFVRGTLIGTATCMVALTLAYAPVAATGAETAEGPADPVEIALGYLEANPDALGVPAADVGDLVVLFQAGAYGCTASPTAFLSHPAPLEVLV